MTYDPKGTGVWYEGKRRCTTPEYTAWQNMRNRCLNPRGQDYSYYGGRGITMTPAWNTYAQFLADMGPRPSRLHTLDRIDTNGPYCKENCRWATRQQQARNRRFCRFDYETAEEIRKLYATGKYRQTDIAKMYGTNQSAISQITRRAAWK